MQTLPRQPIRQGLTLIEVVAGLALMATILVAMLVMKTRFTHQLAFSNQHLRAVAAADSLLEQWWADPAKFPINRSGAIPQYPGFDWQTNLVENDVVARLDSRVVRLDIVADAKVVTSVEVMLPQPHRHAK
jgi:Tfp pilus assembly protein PilV